MFVRSFLILLSLAFFALSGWLLYGGFTMDTTVPGSAQNEFAPVANLQLMHVQLLNFVLGAISGLAGVVLLAASAIVGAIERLGSGRAEVCDYSS